MSRCRFSASRSPTCMKWGGADVEDRAEVSPVVHHADRLVDGGESGARHAILKCRRDVRDAVHGSAARGQPAREWVERRQRRRRDWLLERADRRRSRGPRTHFRGRGCDLGVRADDELTMARLQDVVLRGTSGAKPAASAVPVATLYYSTDTQVLERSTGSAWQGYSAIAGSGDVSGPASSLDQAIVLFDGVTGKILKDSGVVVSSLAPKASPALTGTPTAPTAVAGTDTTQIATTAFVAAAAAAVPSGVVTYEFSASTSAPPGANQIRLDAGSPYTAVTKIWARNVTSGGVDIFNALRLLTVGDRLNIQDKNDHTEYASFTVTGTPIDNTTYFEIPVAHLDHGSALSGGQPVLFQRVGMAPAAAGDVSGPASATNNGIVLFDGTTGK